MGTCWKQFKTSGRISAISARTNFWLMEKPREPSIEQRHPYLWQQFRDAYDMRNLLTHEYFRVDPAIVWTTVKNHLPQLESLLRAFSDGNDEGADPPELS